MSSLVSVELLRPTMFEINVDFSFLSLGKKIISQDSLVVLVLCLHLGNNDTFQSDRLTVVERMSEEEDGNYYVLLILFLLCLLLLLTITIIFWFLVQTFRPKRPTSTSKTSTTSSESQTQTSSQPTPHHGRGLHNRPRVQMGLGSAGGSGRPRKLWTDPRQGLRVIL